jgi:hypothetical protein
MTIRERIDKELDRVQALRDELDVQAHLAKIEAQEELGEIWKKAEHARAKLEAEFARIKDGTEEPRENIGEAAEMLLDEVKNGYKKLRELI